MCWWPSSANVLPWREVFTKFYRFSASRFSRKCPFYRRSKHSTPNRTYSITLTSSFFSTSNRTGMGRNESIRANRIDHHAPRSLNVNLERRNRADIVEIDIGCHAIHVTVVAENTIPKENGVAAWPIQRNNINPVIAVDLVLLSDI